MSVQFKHVRDFFNIGKGGATIAVDLSNVDLSKVDLNNSVDSIKIGMSVCSNKDCFSKKTGRDLAISRLKPTSLKVTAVEKKLSNGKIFSKVVLETESICLGFTQSSDSAKFRLSSVILTS